MPHHSIVVPPPPEWRSPDTSKMNKTRRYALKIVTPMFGGGFRAGEVDMLNPVHAAGVRGNLRFWWRATLGAQYPTSQQLFAAEEELWGSMKRPGKVATRIHIEVESLRNLQHCLKSCAEYNPRKNDSTKFKSVPDPLNGYPLYALQAFSGELSRDSRDVVTEPAMGLVDFPFELLVTCSDEAQKAVALAISAWVRFGGIGARTRRGCGSLTATGGLPDMDLEQAVEAHSLLTVLGGAEAYVGTPRDNAIAAWSEAVKHYQNFRQGVGEGRDVGAGGTPGRSWWPEPNTIRDRTGNAAQYHPVPPNARFGFPRADLGLPIIFHFKDANIGDPADTTLQGSRVGKQRFASPIITKAMSNGNKQFQPLVLILNAPHVWESNPMAINGMPVSQSDVEMTHADRMTFHPLKGNDARSAFAAYIQAKGYKKL